jgi:hypothetical protein
MQNGLWRAEGDSLTRQTEFELTYFKEVEVHAAFLDCVEGYLDMSKFSKVLEFNRLYTESVESLRALYYRQSLERSKYGMRSGRHLTNCRSHREAHGSAK